MGVDQFVDRMRGREADLASSTVTFRRPTGDHHVGDDLVAAPATGTVVYTGAALVRTLGATDVDAGERTDHQATHLVKIPAGVDVRVGDVGTVDDSRFDDQLVGVTFVVVDPVVDEWSITRRLTCRQQRG